VSSALRRKIREAFAVERLRERQDVLGGTTAAVQQYDRPTSLTERCTEVAHRLAGVWINSRCHAFTSFFDVCELR
jgi:hypothetical protein